MSQSTVPRTPTPEALPHNDTTPFASPDRYRNLLPNIQPQAAAIMTPPPSTQIPDSVKSAQAKFMSGRERSLASPPPSLRIGPPITSGGLYGEVPTLEVIQQMNEEELRRLVSELLPALGEARVTAAHSKLQHSLLAIEKEELAKRAEVEHEATRREVQVLQEGSPVPSHNGYSPLKSPNASVQRNLHLALAHCRELQHENSMLEKRLRSSKKLIAQLYGKNSDLNDHIQLLRQRIKDNREHLNDLQESGAMSIHATPQHDNATPQFRGTPRTSANKGHLQELGSQTITSQDPFDALLQASHVLNGETNSVPSSPNQTRQRKIHPQHMRGAHSLSSLPTTPERRPLTADTMLTTPVGRMMEHRVSFSAPGTQFTNENETRPQDDRESTISASDKEDEPYRDEDLPSSQASQVASSMLRRTLEFQNNHASPIQRPPSASKLTQGKIFGQVTKSGQERIESPLKRNASGAYNQSARNSKKMKMAHSASDRIGLGIKSWSSPDFRKDWQRRVRTHFDQPGRKSRRRNARLAKAAALAPRPVDRLRPIVRCPSIKYNRRVRPGRGFSLAELKEAGISRNLAPTIGISVDHRRANLSMESLTANVERLKAYRARLILFPRKSGQHKKSDSSKEDVEAAMKHEGMAHKTHDVFPVTNITKEEAVGEVKRSEMPKGTEKAYRTLREARSEARLVGVREKRVKAKAEEAAATKK
ncbi:MAG: hypothetical protein Q9217_004303 [Psora testacea]